MRRRDLVWGSVLLSVALLAWGIADNVRPWRRLQADFLELERRELRDRQAVEAARDEDEEAALRATVEEETRLLDDQRADVDRLEDELRAFRGKLRRAERRRDALLVLGTARDDELLEARIEIEGFRELVDNRQQRLAEMRSGLADAEEAWARFTAPRAAFEERLAELERGTWMRNVPLLGLFRPGIAVREVTLPAAAGGPPRVDRCATCHLAADREGFDGDRWPAAFRSHPRLDLFVGKGSPHPYSRFGCAVCHGGEGRATDFGRAGHAPADAAAGRSILPADLVESSCVGCHGDAAGDLGAAAAEAGRRLIALAGCAACHEEPAVAGLPRAGPSLADIADKTRPGWAYRFIAAPRALRPTTLMPHFFDLETGNGSRPEQRAAEVAAIVSYLWERSQRREYPPPPEGDEEAGRALFESIGCTACHLRDPDARREDVYPHLERLHGPNLAGSGDQLEAAWLFAWLRDPRRHRPQTPMPSLRLSEQEAADLTAFLTARQGPGGDGGLPTIDAATRGALVLADLRETLTVAAAAARLEAMSERERDLYLGEHAIARYGCHGCHEIPGFEDVPPPAAGRLADLGDPRRPALDGGVPGARLHRSSPAPDYGWNRREAAALRVNLLGRGWGAEPLAAAAEPPELTAGRALLDRYGCRACHRIDGPRVGEPETVATAAHAPDLAAEGAKVRADWLFNYLRDPGSVAVRPWLALRMPTFHWSGRSLEALVRFFVVRDGAGLFEISPSPDARDLAVGRAVYRLLQCGRCHPGGSDAGGLEIPQRAPAYELARSRLRPGWTVDWILDPRRWDPETVMPAHFMADGERLPDASFLAANLATPMFREERDALERIFETDEELAAYFADAERVAAAVRDYLWSFGG